MKKRWIDDPMNIVGAGALLFAPIIIALLMILPTPGRGKGVILTNPSEDVRDFFVVEKIEELPNGTYRYRLRDGLDQQSVGYGLSKEDLQPGQRVLLSLDAFEWVNAPPNTYHPPAAP